MIGQAKTRGRGEAIPIRGGESRAPVAARFQFLPGTTSRGFGPGTFHSTTDLGHHVCQDNPDVPRSYQQLGSALRLLDVSNTERRRLADAQNFMRRGKIV